MAGKSRCSSEQQFVTTVCGARRARSNGSDALFGRNDGTFPPGCQDTGSREHGARVSRHAEDLQGHDQKVITRHYLRLVPLPGESLAQAGARLGPWLATLGLPAGELVMWERRESYDTGKPVFDSYRSYVVGSQTILGGNDLREATPIIHGDGSTAVGVKFSDEAGERLWLFTREHRRERMAIVIDGQVESAPVIISEISGGLMQITLSHFDDPETARVAAQRLAARMTGR